MSDVKLTMHVPTHLHHTYVRQLTKEMTALVGGVSITDMRGEWFDDAGHEHIDFIIQFQWCFTPEGRTLQEIAALARKFFEIASVLLDKGEKSVYVEKLNHDGFTFTCMDRDDIEEVVSSIP